MISYYSFPLAGQLCSVSIKKAIKMELIAASVPENKIIICVKLCGYEILDLTHQKAL